MKHPVLRVKKGKESYDDRENRLAEANAAREFHYPAKPEKRRSGSLPRMRPGSLLPLFIIVLIAAVLLRVLPRSAARANIDGWHALLQARVFGDTLHVGVAFSRLNPEGTGVDGTRQMVSVIFALPDTGEEVQALGILSDSRVALRSQMRYVASEKTLRAIVRVDGQSRTLSIPIHGP
jgi:hypothetical protein